MSSLEELSLVIIGEPKNLKESLAKEFNLEGLKIHIDNFSNATYKVVLIDASDSQSDREKILQNLTPESSTQKVLAVLVADSFLPPNQIESQLLLLNLKQSAPNTNLRTIIVFDLYSPRSPDLISHFEDWLYRVYIEQKIQTSKKGNFPLFPTSVSDLSKMIIKALFSQNTKGQMFCLAGESINDLDFALLLKEKLSALGKSLDLDASLDKENSYLYKNDIIQSQAKLNLLPKDQISDYLHDLLLKFKKEQAVFSVSYTTPTHKLTPHKLQRIIASNKMKKEKTDLEDESGLKRTQGRGLIKIAKITVVTSLFIILTPIILFSGLVFINSQLLYQSYQQFRLSQTTQARLTLKRAKLTHEWSTFWFQIALPFTNIVSPSSTKEINNYILLLSHADQFLQDVYDSYSLSDHYFQGLIGKTDQSVDQSLVALQFSLDNLLDNLSQIQLLINQAKLPFGIQTKIQTHEFPEQISTLKKQLNTGSSLIDLLIAVSRQKTPLRILILVQDENELRGSGGYLNTTISLTLNQNKIQAYQVEPALNVDRLIDGRVEAPPIVGQALGQNTWFFRDSNLNASFSEVGPQISWFYNRFKQVPIQAVLAVNSRLLQDILKWTEPITLSSGQTINSDNLPILLSSITTDPNQDTLTSLSDQIMKKITTGNLPFVPLARSIAKGIEDQNVSLWFADKTLQSLVPDNLTQVPVNKPCHAQLSIFNCQQETIYLNENNLSVAKINAYLKREQQHQVIINKDGSVNYLLSYIYSYPVPAPNNLNQNYNAYYQLYLSRLSSINKISLDGQEYNRYLISSSPYNDLTRYEFYLPQSINQNHRLTLEITSGHKIDLTKPNIPFSLSFLKQPGTKDLFNLSIQYPNSMSPKIITSKLSTQQSGSLVGSFSSVPSSPVGILFRNLEL